MPSRRWQASYVGPDLRRHNAPHTFTAKLDAEGWLSAERRLIELDQWTPPAQRRAARRGEVLTVGRYAATWVAERGLKYRTRRHYESLLANHIEPMLGHLPLSGLNAREVRAWHAALAPGHPTTRAHAYSLLHAVLATAVTDGLITTNPCSVPRAMRAPRRREPVILGVAEVAALAEAIRPERLRAMVQVMAWCGLRWGEVSELRRKDISADGAVLTVSRAVTRRDGAYRVDRPKSGRVRNVVVPPHVRADLVQHLDEFVGDGPEALLFPAARGGHLNDRVFSREYFAKALKAIEREDVRVHDLRHFQGTQVARVGTLRESMDRLGHSTVAASLIYQGIVSGRDAQIAEALSALAEEEE
ncbi:site-specific integrase [Mycobacterium sp. IS-1556]|uniref:tyrosine-type recombinase/integrase n=1 Tax=Mycobacterium sp. IS-1556 TaxID=1772276 RepID=UPI00257008EA|nr:site-specific integrase [Mycobacterium sp. IS-1556]